jgi:hypothetical protein
MPAERVMPVKARLFGRNSGKFVQPSHEILFPANRYPPTANTLG